jgi:membrane protease YdiL (CAAX protease family)
VNRELIDAFSENWQPPTQAFPETDQPTWTWQETARGALLTLVPWLGIAVLSLFSTASQKTPTQRLSTSADLVSAVFTFLLQSLLEGVFLIAPLWFAVIKPRRLARYQGLPLPTLRASLRGLGYRPVRPLLVLGAAVGGMVVIYLAGILYTLVADALQFSTQTNIDIVVKEAAAAPYTAVAILIAAVVVAPVCEETFFRSFLFQGLRLRLNVWLAVVLSAVIFAIGHGDPGSLTLLVVIGLMLAILRWRTQSIWPGIALHMLNNALGAIVVFQAIHF